MDRVKVGKTSSYQIADKGSLPRMLNFIDREGNMLCGSYAHLHIACATEEYLNLEFTRHKVLVKGRNLAGISRAVAAHRLVFLREQVEPEPVDDSEPYIFRMCFLLKGGPENLQDYVMTP